ncbi:MAG: 30S ribosomal protein S3 [Mycoplasmoidaceae bacterium]|nr:30S ribosomal protein S3 [Mycoplasmoidaceae bacterium]
MVEVEIDRTQKSISVVVKAGQPGLIAGANNANEKDNILAINKIVGRKIKVTLNLVQYENVAVSARVIAREIADAIENRVSFRVAQKMGIAKAMRAHAKGIKTNVSGRLGGVEMAREEGYSQGVIPLSTFRANIDYALEEAHTTYGQIGVKV